MTDICENAGAIFHGRAAMPIDDLHGAEAGKEARG